MKRKLFILSTILGIIFCFLALAGFISLNSVKKEIAGYDGSKELYKNVYDWDTQEYVDNYWDYLANHECTTVSTCYCDFVDNEKDCLKQLLNGTGKHTNANEGEVFLMKNRYILLVLTIVCFIGTWLFHEKKVKTNKKVDKED